MRASIVIILVSCCFLSLEDSHRECGAVRFGSDSGVLLLGSLWSREESY